MNLLLTDLLDCPRCRGGAGLILLADRVEGRVVHEGQLGCPQCRSKFAVREGVAHFGDSALGAESSSDGGAEEIAALLGVTEAPATLVLIGDYGAQAARIAEMIDGVQLVVAGGVHAVSHPNVSFIEVDEQLPLRDRTARGVWHGGDAGLPLREAARVCALASRFVLRGVMDSAAGELEPLGFRVAAQDATRLVAVRVS
jgi:uncharacterized protein YbaR (Trm112 family)